MNITHHSDSQLNPSQQAPEMTDKPLQEKCGIVAVYTPQASYNFPIALVAAKGVQHRGQHGAGVAEYTKKGIISYTGNGLLNSIFNETRIKKLNRKNIWTMLHCRYGTFGGYNELNLQPCIARSVTGSQVVVAHNGQFILTDKLKRMIDPKDGTDVSDTYLFTKLLASIKNTDRDAIITTALQGMKGAYSLFIAIDDTLYAARDDLGIRPLIIGEIKNGWIITSETHALDKVGAKIIREVKRGEVIKCTNDGIVTVVEGAHGVKHFCDFEWCYFSRPDSLYTTHESKTNGSNPDKWLSVYEFRERCGEVLAEEAPIKNTSYVVGIPDSGITIGFGYANKLGLQCRQLIIRDHFDANGSQRLFMRDDEKDKIEHKILGKLSLIPDKKLWKNKIITLCDDSIVRGNVSAKITKAVFALGAKEVHWIVGFPPVIHRCHLGVSIRTTGELIAARHKGDAMKIAKEIGATSVNYISFKGFIQARKPMMKVMMTKDPKDIFLKNGGCGGCVTGRYPVI